MDNRTYRLPAEWEPQRMVQLTWPHEATDWNGMLDKAEDCFARIAFEIAKRESLLVVSPHPMRVAEQLRRIGVDMTRVTLHKCPTNDTWARDHGFITVKSEKSRAVMKHLDFCFNGWGLKFASHLDNQINRSLHAAGLMEGEYVDCLDFVLEGGSIESDGKGTLMTTSHCLTAPNRNARHLTKETLEKKLSECFGIRRVLWLDHGYLAGDDTDSHIDTLARLCPDDTIAYVQCTDKQDEHYKELHLMEEQLRRFRTLDGQPYRLVPLPMTAPIYAGEERLPATYANFLIMNGAVLYPTYGQPEKDTLAGKQLKQIFPNREIVGIDCSILIHQHGSLHCVTMQYPLGEKKKENSEE